MNEGRHRATSATLRALRPAPTAAAQRHGVLIGLDRHHQLFRYDPWQLYDNGVITNPNLFIVGDIGTGKSALIKTLIARSIPYGRRAAIIDPKGEYHHLAHATGGTVITLTPDGTTRLNPLEHDNTDPATSRTEQLGLLAALLEAGLGRPLTPTEHAACDSALQQLPQPSLRTVAELLLDPDPDTAHTLRTTIDDLRAITRDVALAARRLHSGELGGLLDADTNTALRLDANVVVFQFDRIPTDLMPAVLTSVAAAIHTRTRQHPGENYLVIDEAWKLLEHLPTARWIRARTKLARSTRTATVLATQRLTDLNAAGESTSEHRALAHGLITDTGTQILLPTPASERPALTDLLQLDRARQHQLASLQRHEALWLYSNHAAAVTHRLAACESALVDTDSPHPLSD